MSSLRKKSEWVAAETGLGLKAPTGFSAEIVPADRTAMERIVKRFPFGGHVAALDLLFLGGACSGPVACACRHGGSMVDGPPVCPRVFCADVFPGLALDAASRLDGVKPGKSTWGLALVGLGAVAPARRRIFSHWHASRASPSYLTWAGWLCFWEGGGSWAGPGLRSRSSRS